MDLLDRKSGEALPHRAWIGCPQYPEVVGWREAGSGRSLEFTNGARARAMRTNRLCLARGGDPTSDTHTGCAAGRRFSHDGVEGDER